MHDAELLLGLWRHLSAYSASPSTAALGSLEAAGKIYEMAWRLRGSGLSSLRRVHAIGVEAKIRTFELERLILPTLEQLGWIRINSLVKLQGLARFAADLGEEFHRIEAVTKIGPRMRVLDLQIPLVREAILASKQPPLELYRLDIAIDYVG